MTLVAQLDGAKREIEVLKAQRDGMDLDAKEWKQIAGKNSRCESGVARAIMAEKEVMRLRTNLDFARAKIEDQRKDLISLRQSHQLLHEAHETTTKQLDEARRNDPYKRIADLEVLLAEVNSKAPRIADMAAIAETLETCGLVEDFERVLRRIDALLGYKSEDHA